MFPFGCGLFRCFRRRHLRFKISHTIPQTNTTLNCYCLRTIRDISYSSYTVINTRYSSLLPLSQLLSLFSPLSRFFLRIPRPPVCLCCESWEGERTVCASVRPYMCRVRVRSTEYEYGVVRSTEYGIRSTYGVRSIDVAYSPTSCTTFAVYLRH